MGGTKGGEEESWRWNERKEEKDVRNEGASCPTREGFSQGKEVYESEVRMKERRTGTLKDEIRRG